MPGQGAGTRLALVVDDEVFARLFATQILEDAGFATIEADSSTEALDILDRESRVSIMITDVCMPGDRDGLVLAKKVADCFPGVAILIVSGKARPAFTDLPPGSKFLAKPYTAHDLASVLRQVTSRSGDEPLSPPETSTLEPPDDPPANQESMDIPIPRLAWLKRLRSTAAGAIRQAEEGLPYLDAPGDEHLRDATEAWLDHHRAFAAKLERRIRLEDNS